MSAIDTQIWDRDVHGTDVSLSTGTQAVADMIKDRALSGILPTFEEMSLTLQSQGAESDYWTTFLAHLEPKCRPATIPGLGRLTYIIQGCQACPRG